MAARLFIIPIELDEANALVRRWHRHSHPVVGHRFSIGVAEQDGDEIVVRGVAIVGRPIARELKDGWTVEVLRCCTDGVRNGCSKLYSAAWRAARQMGYRRCITYIRDTEHGASLMAAGWRCVGKAGGGSWNCPSRPRVDKHPSQGKLRFEIA